MADPASLIERYCKKQDQAAFRHFYDDEAPRLWKFLLSRGADEALAYDLLADAFERFLKSACKDTTAPRALLYRIAINLQIDHYRRQKHRDHQALDEQMAPDPAFSGQDQTEIHNLLTKLPDFEQNLLLMRYWVGLTHREIAEALDKPEGSIRRQAAESLKKLRELCK